MDTRRRRVGVDFTWNKERLHFGGIKRKESYGSKKKGCFGHHDRLDRLESASVSCSKILSTKTDIKTT